MIIRSDIFLSFSIYSKAFLDSKISLWKKFSAVLFICHKSSLLLNSHLSLDDLYSLISTPASFASSLAASKNSALSISIMNLIAFPHTPQPKHLNICLSSDTIKDGVFSL